MLTLWVQVLISFVMKATDVQRKLRPHCLRQEQSKRLSCHL